MASGAVVANRALQLRVGATCMCHQAYILLLIHARKHRRQPVEKKLETMNVSQPSAPNKGACDLRRTIECLIRTLNSREHFLI